ncbi:hypothetical protein [Streptomyces formicae]
MRALDFAAALPAGAAAYSTIVALQDAGMPERPAHALGAVALIVYLTLLALLIDHFATARAVAPYRDQEPP